jgi:hypothetical protein
MRSTLSVRAGGSYARPRCRDARRPRDSYESHRRRALPARLPAPAVALSLGRASPRGRRDRRDLRLLRAGAGALRERDAALRRAVGHRRAAVQRWQPRYQRAHARQPGAARAHPARGGPGRAPARTERRPAGAAGIGDRHPGRRGGLPRDPDHGRQRGARCAARRRLCAGLPAGAAGEHPHERDPGARERAGSARGAPARGARAGGPRRARGAAAEHRPGATVGRPAGGARLGPHGPGRAQACAQRAVRSAAGAAGRHRDRLPARPLRSPCAPYRGRRGALRRADPGDDPTRPAAAAEVPRRDRDRGRPERALPLAEDERRPRAVPRVCAR